MGALGEHARGVTQAAYGVKLELAESETQRRQREEELTNQSYVLKYLVDVNARLRVQRQHAEESADIAASHLAGDIDRAGHDWLAGRNQTHSASQLDSPGALDRVLRRRQQE